ncbi:A-kinase anchor protein 9 isoform X7 [Danio rerio]|uniref:A-kinase anchor protein 9 isoform X7 n=1 Tax=Danio rerio TaxID=7955 RepID=A0AC58HZG7_DANRE
MSKRRWVEFKISQTISCSAPVSRRSRPACPSPAAGTAQMMEDEERQRKLQAGKAKLAEYRQRKAQSDGQKKKKKKKKPELEPTEGESANTVFSVSKTLRSGETVTHDQTYTIEPESEVSTTAEDCSSEVNGFHQRSDCDPAFSLIGEEDLHPSETEAQMEADLQGGGTQNRMQIMEDELEAKNMAMEELSRELEDIRSAFGTEGVQQLQDFEEALKQRDEIITQLTSNLQQARTEKEEVMREFLELTEQSQKLQIQFQQLQAGEILRSSNISSTAADLLQARTQITLYQQQLEEREAQLRLQQENTHTQISLNTQMQERLSRAETVHVQSEQSFAQTLREKDLLNLEHQRLIAEHTQTISQLRDQLQTSIRELNEVNERLSAKTHALDNCEKELSASRQKERMSSGEILQLMKSVEDLQQRSHQDRRSETLSEEDWSRRLEQLRDELDEMYGQQITQMKQELRLQHAAEVQRLQDMQSSETEKIILQHQAELERFRGQLYQSTGGVNVLNVKMIELQQKLQETQVLREKAEQELTELREEKRHLLEKLEHLKADLQSSDHLRAAMSDLQMKLDEALKENTSINAEHESEVTNYKIKLDMLEREKDAVLDRMAESQEAELERLRTQLLFSHEEELTRLREDLQMENQLNIENLRDEINTKHQQAIHELQNQLSDALKNMREKESELQQNIQHLSTENTHLHQEIEKQKNTFSFAERNFEVNYQELKEEYTCLANAKLQLEERLAKGSMQAKANGAVEKHSTELMEKLEKENKSLSERIIILERERAVQTHHMHSIRCARADDTHTHSLTHTDAQDHPLAALPPQQLTRGDVQTDGVCVMQPLEMDGAEHAECRLQLEAQRISLTQIHAAQMELLRESVCVQLPSREQTHAHTHTQEEFGARSADLPSQQCSAQLQETHTQELHKLNTHSQTLMEETLQQSHSTPSVCAPLRADLLQCVQDEECVSDDAQRWSEVSDGVQDHQRRLEEHIAKVIVQMSVEFAQQTEHERISKQTRETSTGMQTENSGQEEEEEHRWTSEKREQELQQMKDREDDTEKQHLFPHMQSCSTQTQQKDEEEEAAEVRGHGRSVTSSQPSGEEPELSSDDIITERDGLRLVNAGLRRVLMEVLKTTAAAEQTIGTHVEAILEASSRGQQSNTDASSEGFLSRDVAADRLRMFSADTEIDEGLETSLKDQGAELQLQEAELQLEREEFQTSISTRLQSAVEKLLIAITETSTQLEHARITQTELLREKFRHNEEMEELLRRQEELQERVCEEERAREQLALELHRAEGLIDGYSDERRALEQQVCERAELQLHLEQELQVTSTRLQELEQERCSLLEHTELMSRQRDAMRDSAGGGPELRLVEAALDAAPEADLLEETEKLLQEKVEVQRQAQKQSSELQAQVKQLEAQLEEQQMRLQEQQELQRSQEEDLQQQIQALEKQTENHRRFIDEQAADREHERDVFQQEIFNLEQQLKNPTKTQTGSERRDREVQELSAALQEKSDRCSELLLSSEQLQRDVKDREEEIQTLAARVHQLEHTLMHEVQEVQHVSMAGRVDVTLEAQLQTEREALDRKEKEIVNLEEQLEQFREELENKSEEVNQLNMQLQIQSKEISRYQQELQTHNTLTQAVEQKDEALGEMEALVECLKSEQQRLKKDNEDEVEQLNAVIEKLQQELSHIEARDDHEEMKQRVDELTSECNTLRLQYEQLQEETRDHEEMRKKVEELMSECSSLNLQYNQLQEETRDHEEMRKKIEELTIECNSLQLQYKQLQEETKDHEEMKQRMEELTAESNALRLQCEQVQVETRDPEEMKLKMEELTNESNTLQLQDEQLQGGTRDHEEVKNMEELTTECNSLRLQCEQLQEETRDYKEMKQRVEELTKESNALRLQYEQLQEETRNHEEMKKKMEELTNDSNALRLQYEQLQAETRDHEEMKQKVEELTTECNSLHLQYEQLQEETRDHEDMKKKIEELTNEFNTLRLQYDQLQEETRDHEKMKLKMEAVTTECNTLRLRYEQLQEETRDHEEMGKKMQEVSNESNTLRLQYEQLQAEMKDHEEMKQKMEGMTTERDSLHLQYERLHQETLLELQEALREKTAASVVMQAQVQALEESAAARVDSLSRRVEELQECVEEKDRELRACRMRVEQAQTDAHGLYDKVAQLEDNLREKVAAVLVSQAQLEAVQTQTKELHAEAIVGSGTQLQEGIWMQDDLMAQVGLRVQKSLRMQEDFTVQEGLEVQEGRTTLEGLTVQEGLTMLPGLTMQEGFRAQAKASGGKVNLLTEKLKELEEGLIVMQKDQELQKELLCSSEEEVMEYESRLSVMMDLLSQMKTKPSALRPLPSSQGSAEVRLELQEVKDKSALIEVDLGISRLQEEIQMKESMIAQLQTALREASSGPSGAAETPELIQELQEVKGRAASTHQELQEVKGQLEEVKGQSAHLEELLQDREMSLALLKDQLNRVSQDADQPMAELLQELLEVRGQAASANEDLICCREKISQLQEEIQIRDASITELRVKVQELQESSAQSTERQQPKNPAEGHAEGREHPGTDVTKHPGIDVREHAGMDLREHAEIDLQEHAGMDVREHSGMDLQEHICGLQQKIQQMQELHAAEIMDMETRHISESESLRRENQQLEDECRALRDAIHTLSHTQGPAVRSERPAVSPFKDGYTSDSSSEWSQRTGLDHTLLQQEMRSTPEGARRDAEPDVLPDRIKNLLREVHQEGMQVLSLSELPLGEVERETHTRAHTHTWSAERERDAFCSAVETLKSLISRLQSDTQAAGDWRSELLSVVQQVFVRERELLKSVLFAHLERLDSADALIHLNQLERALAEQDVQHREAMGVLYSADRSSLCSEIQQLRDQLHTLTSEHTHASGMLSSDRLEERLLSSDRLEERLLSSDRPEERLLSSDRLEERLLSSDRLEERLLSSDRLEERLLSSDRPEERLLSSDRLEERLLSSDRPEERLLSSDRPEERLLSSDRLEERLLSSDRPEERLLSSDRLEEMKSELNHTKLELESALNTQHTHLRELDTLRSEVSLRVSEVDTLTDRLAEEQKRGRELQWALEKQKHRLDRKEEADREEVEELRLALEEQRSRVSELSISLEQQKQISDQQREIQHSDVSELQVQLDAQRARCAELSGALEKEKQLNTQLIQRFQSGSSTHTLPSGTQNTLLEAEATCSQVEAGVESVESLLQTLQSQLMEKQTQVVQMMEEMEKQQLEALQHRRQSQEERSALARTAAEHQSALQTARESLREMQSQLQAERENGRRMETEREKLQETLTLLEDRLHSHTARNHDGQPVDGTRDWVLQHEPANTLNLESTCVQQTSADPKHMEKSSDPKHMDHILSRLQLIAAKINSLTSQSPHRLPGEGPDRDSLAWLHSNVQDVMSLLQHIPSAPSALPESVSLLSAGSCSLLNERLLRQNAELTGFVSRLTEEKNELRNQILKLEDELRRYRQHRDNTHTAWSRSAVGRQDLLLSSSERESWAQERNSLQKSLRQTEAELNRVRSELRCDTLRDLSSADPDNTALKRMYGKYLRAESFRKALIYQKKYLLLLLGGFQECEDATLTLISHMGALPGHCSPHTQQRRGITRFRSAARVSIALSRMRFLVKRWQRASGGSTTPQILSRNGLAHGTGADVRNESSFLSPAAVELYRDRRATSRGRTGRESPRSAASVQHRFVGVPGEAGGLSCSHLQNYDPDRALTDYISRLEALQRRLGSVQSGSSSYAHFSVRR